MLIKQKLQTMSQPLALLEEVRKSLNAIRGGEGDRQGRAAIGDVVTTIFAVLTPAVSQFILFIGALVFYLVYQKSCAARRSIFAERPRGAAHHLAHAERHRRTT